MRNPALEKLRAGRPVFGIMVTMPSVPLVQIVVNARADYAFFDLEHSPIGIESLHAMIAATRASHTSTSVRVPITQPWIVKNVLDAGATGICYPLVRSADDARLAVSSTKYPPQGLRGWGPFYAHYHFGDSLPDYVVSANSNIICEVLIEHIDAIKNIKDIVAVPGVDVATIAPNDLSLSMGHIPGGPFAPERLHPEVREAMLYAEKVIKDSPVVLGGPAPSKSYVPQMLERGYRYVTLSNDWRMFEVACSELLDDVRSRD